MFGNEMLQRISIYIALAGSIFASGFGFGFGYGKSQYSGKLKEVMEKREEQIRYVDKIVTEYVEKIVTREVPVYVKSDNDCDHVSGNFRMFHDRVATGKELPEASSNLDEGAATIEEVANTIADNYSACHDNADQLTALQKWAREVGRD